MKNRSRKENSAIVYNLRKTLLYLQRARLAAAQAGDSESLAHIKRMSIQITQRIKYLTNE